MKNKEITMLGLANRIYNRIAPKKIKYDGDVWEYCEDDCNYYSENQDVMLNNEYISILKFLDDKVEILPEENEMKEMIYQVKSKKEVLYSGTYKGYEFYIMNLGTHPTAYVNVINNKLLAMKNYNNIDISVHGGLTFSEDSLYIDREARVVKGWFLGWDYGHFNDYNGYEMNMPESIRSNGKKWTTEEIYEEVKSVIEQCINYKENDEWEDMEELGMIYNGNTEEEIMRNRYIINKLIKNQKYLKEKLESKDE